MVEWLIEPLRYTFAIRGLVASILAAVSCAALSAFVVWRGMSFIGDAVAHSILPGIVIAFMLGLSMLVGALVAACVAALGIGSLTRKQTVREDTAIGVIFTGLFALGILLLSRTTSYKDLTHILFGNLLGVGINDIYILVGIAAVIAVSIAAFYKELLVTSFDPAHATVIGLSPEAVRFGLLLMIALTVVAGIQSVGVVLVLALLVTPAAVASLLVNRLGAVILLSEIVAVLSSIVGFYASYYLDVASGASIVLVLSLAFIIAFLVHRVRMARG